MLSKLITTTKDPYISAQSYTEIDLKIPHPDLLILDSETSIGIEEVRGLKKFTSISPYTASHQVIFIPYASKLTIESQNALLKLLEEPPEYTQIILVTQNADQLLPTIQSRCQTITISEKYISPEIPTEITEFIQSLPKLNHGQKITAVMPYTKTKLTALEFCTHLTHVYRQILLDNPQKKISQNLNLIHEIMTHLNANANPMLTLTHLALNLQGVTF